MASSSTPSDRPAALGVVFLFSVALGIATVTVPLLALSAGYDAAAVGFLVATSAGAQLAVRLSLPRLLGRFPDRNLIALAGATMVVGLGLVASTERLAAMADRLAELDGANPATLDLPNAVATRVPALLADLIETAKATALEKLSEGERAVRLATAWLRAKAPGGA